MSGQPTVVTSGLIDARRVTGPWRPPPAAVARDAVSEWAERVGRYALEAVQAAERGERERIEGRLYSPSHAWTAKELTRAYRPSAAGDRRFREEADVLTSHGYVAWLQPDPTGTHRGGRLLLGSSLARSTLPRRWRGHPDRVVTWATA